MTATFEQRTAIVSGASTGIGRGIALLLASRGYDLAITHLNEKEEALDVSHTIEREHGRRCLVFQGDFTDADTVRRVIEQCVRELKRVHVLVNNAGITKFSRIVEMDIDDMNQIMMLNFRSHILATQTVAAHMIEEKIAGSIVNISSVRGERAFPLDAVYGGMKAALTRASQSIALELAPHGIRVNCVAPGAIMVRDNREEFYAAFEKKIPLGRRGVPNDIAKAVAWLCSEDADYVTGITVRVDGGLILPGMPEDVRPEAGYGWGEIRNKR